MNRIMRFACLALTVSACASGAPPGFPKNADSWSAPLIGPLENDLYLVPVSINDVGPFLFQIDPDSATSAIDEGIKEELDIWTLQQADGLTEDDNKKQVMVADVKKITVGTLDVRRRFMKVLPNGLHWKNGRKIRGVLGRDIISDSLVLQANRDLGMVYLSTQGNSSIPEDAAPIRYDMHTVALDRYYRTYIAEVRVNGGPMMEMHLDLGSRMSKLWAHKQKELRIPSLPTKSVVVDEFGAVRTITHGGLLASVEAGGQKVNGVRVIDYQDLRFEKNDLDGSLGQNFFSKFNVTADWHHKIIWVAPRRGDLSNVRARLSRWGNALQNCETPACVTIDYRQAEAASVVDGPSAAQGENPSPDAIVGSAPGAAPAAESGAEASALTPPGLTEPLSISLTRTEPGLSKSYEVLLGAVNSEGKLLGLPYLVATLPAGRADVRNDALTESYRDAAGFVVLDMSPLGARECQATECIWTLNTSL